VMHIEAEDPISFQDKLFFNAYPGGVLSLWSSDGTLTGTVPIAPLPSQPQANCGVVGQQLFFVTYLNATTREVWASDGTAPGTLPLQAVWSSYSGLICARYQGLLYFTGNLSDHELWMSDGTPEGTLFVTVTEPDPAGGGIRYLTAVNDILYFSAYDPINGRELWKSDGTAQGTLPLKDIHPGLGDSNPRTLTAVFDTLYFTADDGVHGEELWQSDGTPEGTFMVADIYSGTDGSMPTDLSLFQNRFHSTLFFQAEDGVHGRELWALRLYTYNYEVYLPMITEALLGAPAERP
jgi:ELWxxDGT repeat protein